MHHQVPDFHRPVGVKIQYVDKRETRFTSRADRIGEAVDCVTDLDAFAFHHRLCSLAESQLVRRYLSFILTRGGTLRSRTVEPRCSFSGPQIRGHLHATLLQRALRERESFDGGSGRNKIRSRETNEEKLAVHKSSRHRGCATYEFVTFFMRAFCHRNGGRGESELTSGTVWMRTRGAIARIIRGARNRETIEYGVVLALACS